jgi:hypothetical protein
MSTGTAIVLVGGLGVAAFLYFRSQQQQVAAVQVAAQQQAAAAAGGGSGGGVGGLVKRGIAQWMQDPLGIANTKSALSAGAGVVKAGFKEAISLPSDIIGGIRSIF